MYINCKGNLTVKGHKLTAVHKFKYLGLMLSDNCTKPEIMLQARISKAVGTFHAVRTNCRLLGISNVRVKLQLINALVSSVLQYGCVVYACLSNVESALEPTNTVFAQAEIFVRTMLRWALNVDMNTRSSFLYMLAN